MPSEAAPVFEALAKGFYLEGLFVDDDDVWFTDVVVGGVQRLGSDRVLLPERTMIGGLLRNRDGRMLVAGLGGIAWADTETGAEGMLVDGFDGTNEMVADGQGGIVFGIMDLPAILRGARPGPSAIIHLSQDHDVRRLYEGLNFANGLAIAQDGTMLFFNESFSASLAFPIEAGFTLGAPRLLADKPDCDGMAMDADGNLWITGFASGYLLCVAPDGREVRRLALPGKAASSVRFGGADMRDLYINVVDPAAAQGLADGTPLTEKTSVLYRTRSPVPGMAIERPCFDLEPPRGVSG